MSKDNTDGKRHATTRKELLDLMEDLKIELGGDDEWLRILGARLREHYPGTYEGIMKLTWEDIKGKPTRKTHDDDQNMARTMRRTPRPRGHCD